MTDQEIKTTKDLPVNPSSEETPIETLEEVKTMSENYETLKATVDAMTSDFEKFNLKKIKAAGQRARSNLLTIKKLCDTLRKQIITDIKEIPIKHRIDTDDEVTVETLEPPVKKVRKTRRANRKVLETNA